MIGQVMQMILTLVSVVVLSRLLPPSDFGLIAMAAVVTGLGELLRDLGLTVAALRTPSLSQQQASNLFWVNTLLSLIAGAAIAFSGPLLASIYGDSRLVSVTPVLALAFFFSGMQAQIQVSLSRAKKFAVLAIIAVTSNAVGIVTAITLALLGAGYWALVVQVVAVSFSELVFKAYAARWVPLAPRRNAGTRQLLTTGLDYAGSSFVQYFSANADTFVLGMRWGATEVGLYSRAKQLSGLPLTFLSPLVNVAVPILNEAKARGEDIQDHLLRIQSMIGLWITLMYVALGVSAPALFRFALGEEWVEAAPLFQILAAGCAVKALSQVSWWSFLVLGASRDLLKYNLVSKTATTLLVAAGAFHSPSGAALGLSSGYILSWLLNIQWLKVTARLRARSFYANGFRFLSMGLLAAAFTSVLTALVAFGSTALVTFLAQAIVGSGIYLALIAATADGRRDLRASVTFVRGVVGGA